jgi:replicative DNA helicase
MRAKDVAEALTDPPTDSAPPEPGPPWQTIADIGETSDYAEGLPSITTGFDALDKIIGGFRPESSYVLAGRTGTSKSTLALNIARRVALSGHGVLVFKLEESVREAVYRMHAAASQVPFSVLLDGAKHAEPEDRERLADGWDLIQALPIRMSDERAIDTIQRVTERHAKEGGQLVVVDQLSMVDVLGRETAYERATAISNRLRILARSCQIPILLVSQVNRDAAKKKRESLGVNDLRDSGALENDAAAVILIDRVRTPDGPQYGGVNLVRYLQIVIPKNRYGPVVEEKPVQLLWWPRMCRIEDVADDRLEDDQ